MRAAPALYRHRISHRYRDWLLSLTDDPLDRRVLMRYRWWMVVKTQDEIDHMLQLLAVASVTSNYGRRGAAFRRRRAQELHRDLFAAQANLQ